MEMKKLIAPIGWICESCETEGLKAQKRRKK